MVTSRTIEVVGVGPMLFKKSRRARGLRLSLENDNFLRVVIPYWLSYKEAVRTIASNTKWVHKYLLRMQRWSEDHKKLPKNTIKVEGIAAKEALFFRAWELAKEFGFCVNKISIRSQKTRWGSCSAKNNISLNIKLTKLPGDIMDYVILHELVHTRESNHGKRFWQEMEKIVNKARELDRKLKKYNLGFL